MQPSINFRLNGRPVKLRVAASRPLLSSLRGELGLTGAKYGCGSGFCGACTVLVDGRAVRACLTTLGEVRGREVLTIEGLARGGKLHALQQAFVDHGALQCGYCTPGMIMTALALLRADPHPSRAAICAAMEGNLCRCGSHQRILDAIESVARS
jgi:aerobic-type carbon monoxide dehydrogenase small subunit (CoxS/CutS family)